MALTILIEVSTSGVGDASFSPVTTLPDLGSGFSFDYSPATPGQLYIFRARRRDDTKAGTACEYSAWTYLFSRAPSTTEGNIMAVNDIMTGTDTAIWVAIEAAETIPTRVAWQGEYLSGGVVSDLIRVYGRTFRNASTMRRKVVKGRAVYQGDLELEITPEGAFPRILFALFPCLTTQLAIPTRYRHRFSNQFNSKTITLVQQKGQTSQTNGALYVYPGCKISQAEFTVSKEQDTVFTVRLSLVALDEWVYELSSVPTAPTLLGVSTATADPLNPYSPVDAVASVGGVTGSVRSMTFTVNRNLSREFVLDGKRGARSNYEGRNEVTGSASLFFETMTNLRRDMTGTTTTPTGAYAAGDTIATAPVSFVFTPTNNSSGFSNILGFYAPNCDIKTDQPVQGEGEIPENLQLFPIDAIGDSSGTDFYIELTNSESFTSLNQPGAAIVAAPTSSTYLFEYGVAAGISTTSVVQALNSTHLNPLGTDGNYVGRTLKFLTGNNGTPTQQIRTITGSGYGGSPRTFTLGSPLPFTPAGGDIFDII